MNHTVLLVDDEPHVLSGLTRVLHKESYRIVTADSAEQAMRLMDGLHVDVIVCDEEMPGMKGTEFLARVAKTNPEIIRIVLTGHPSLPAALRAINEGSVYQFFTKPCNEVDLAIAIRHALEQKDLLEKSRDLLEVTKRQSVLIDEARALRRKSDTRPRTPETTDKDGPTRHQQELLDEIEEAIATGRALLKAVKH